MKQWLALLLAVSLCVSLAACGGTGNETYDYIIHLLEEGNYDMAIYVIEGLRDGTSGEQPQQPVADPSGDPYHQHYEMPPEFNGTDWMFHIFLENQIDEEISLEAMIITDYLDGVQNRWIEFVNEDLAQVELAGVTLAPHDIFDWHDAHPAVTDFNQRTYQFIFRDSAGGQVDITYVYHMEDRMPGQAGNPSMEQPSGDWFFPIVLENTSDTPWELYAMDITNLMDGNPLGTSIFEGEESLAQIGLGGLILEPGQQSNWNDAHPAVSDWNGREYRFHFMDGNGQKQSLIFRFENLQEQQNQLMDYSQDQGKDLRTLRHDVYFEQEVHPGVYWVPAVALGASRYSNMDIHQMLPSSPEEKQNNIATLYEALQLYQVGNFTPSDDNIRSFEGNVNWEHHKPGYHAVRTNTGCCATDSNWLRYILDGDYEEVGYIATSQRDGSGHIYNYILHKGWYYIIDLTHYHANGNPMMTAEENGDLNTYHATDFILGNIHKVQNIQDYVDYVQNTFHDAPGLMFQYTYENCLAVDGPHTQNGVQIIYEEVAGLDIHVIFDDPSDALEFVREPAPKNLPDWSQSPDYPF